MIGDLRSLVVVLLKNTLGLAAVGVLTLTLWQGFNGQTSPNTPPLLADTPPLVSGQMVNPRLTGIDAHNRLYTIHAKSAIQADPRQHWIRFDSLNGAVTLPDGREMALVSKNGLFDKDSEALKLSQDILIQDSSGYLLNTEKLLLDVAGQTLVSNSPVQGRAPMGSVSAEGLRIDGRDNTLALTGKTRIHFDD